MDTLNLNPRFPHVCPGVYVCSVCQYLRFSSTVTGIIPERVITPIEPPVRPVILRRGVEVPLVAD